MSPFRAGTGHSSGHIAVPGELPSQVQVCHTLGSDRVLGIEA
jgi:hypothetical protein